MGDEKITIENQNDAMNVLKNLNRTLSRLAMYIACFCLIGLLSVVIYGVIMRYVFNNAPPYVEQVALLLVISVAMFGAAAGVRDAGHIGLDSLVRLLPIKLQFWCSTVVNFLSILFAISLIAGGYQMAVSTYASTIPTLGLSEAYRYLPVIAAGILITLFSTEHIVALFKSEKVIPSWH